jgi:acid phosphatase (class A)
MRPRVVLAAAGGALLLACIAAAQVQPSGYLPGALSPDTVEILPPAPVDGSAADRADRAIFKLTRKLEGTPRWTLAKNDVDSSIPATMTDFSCAVGVTLNAQNAPAISTLLRKVGPNVAAAVNPPKEFYKRLRPYLVAKGDICVPRSDALARNFDYPSGHAAWGWTVGLVLAELAPDRSAPILSRARAFGESRVVCGVHNASAIEGGRTAASSLNAVLNSDATFRADMDAARTELAALRGSAADRPQACPAEAALTARTPW